MINDIKIALVMTAYNASKTLEQTYSEIPHDVVDYILLVDDFSNDDTTVVRALQLNIQVHKHDKNMGYGANQKTCYQMALKTDANIIIMLHPDYQYALKLVRAMCSLIAEGVTIWC